MQVRLHLILLLAFFGLTASAHTLVEYDGYFEVEHSWKFKGKECSITLNISTDLYDYYRNDREHLAYVYKFNEDEMPPNYYSFMLSEHDRPLMRALANEFSHYAHSEKDQIELALSFVQSLPYAFDADSKHVDEYLRYPVETLVDGCGDCEDKVALLVALLYEMDKDFVLLVLPEHMALGVHCDEVESSRFLLFHGQRYYYMETTMPNWQIGQIPEDYRSAEIEVIPVDDTPSLLIKGVHFESQSTFVYEKANCTLQVDLHNLGPGQVTDLELVVRVIEKGKNRLLAEQHYSLNNMREGELRTETLSLKSLIRENSILQVELSGAEVAPQYYEMALDYKKVRN
ncbi:MAG: hypothetical protein IJ057_09390 [Bacteroidales bacterium]|nr:hypothetical protein [Bacteroidales bacterium]